MLAPSSTLPSAVATMAPPSGTAASDMAHRRPALRILGLRCLRALRLAVVGLGLGALAGLAAAAADANKAALEELRTVKGIGPGIAERILDERKKGAFKDWPDFIGRIKGIGDGNAAKFSANGLTINGAGYSGGAAPAVTAAAAKPARAAPAVADAGAKPAKP